MENSAVACPLCFKNFSSINIEKHVQCCVASNDKLNKISPFKRKYLSSKDGACSLKRATPWSKAAVQQHSSCSTSLSTVEKLPDEENTGARKEENTLSRETLPCTKTSKPFDKPLAELTRPCSLNDYVGQTEVVGEGTTLKRLLSNNMVPSMILWGPPGCGKTTLAHIIAKSFKKEGDKVTTRFVKLSATNSGKAEVQANIKAAMNEKRLFGRKTVLFIDEIHRFNKLQQDTFLPYVENGTIILIGATTENPSFALNSALLSRCRVIVLKKIDTEHIMTILDRAIKSFIPNTVIVEDEEGCTYGSDNDIQNEDRIKVQRSALKMLSNYCDGDARIALNSLQLALQSVQSNGKDRLISVDMVKQSLQRSHVLYDKTGDQHYHMLSVLQKSIRGCDDNAALYWLTRMIVGGEDPRCIARRLIRIASEDIGLADPNALTQAVSCYHACLYVGMPECDVSLAQCVIYLARAPKSAEAYLALDKAKKCIQEHEGPLPGVPLHLRNASTQLMKSLGYGKGYKYKSDAEDEQTYLPDELQMVDFFK